jgi:hypothetical protein
MLTAGIIRASIDTRSPPLDGCSVARVTEGCGLLQHNCLLYHIPIPVGRHLNVR